MTLTSMQTFAIIGMVTLGTVITRFLPFILFPANKKTPTYITYLGKVLPYSVIGLLVVYCLKGVKLSASPFGIPEVIALSCIAILHFWKNNALLSIGVGTIVYMFLLQVVFA